jgi:hypothetical protein
VPLVVGLTPQYGVHTTALESAHQARRQRAIAVEFLFACCDAEAVASRQRRTQHLRRGANCLQRARGRTVDGRKCDVCVIAADPCVTGQSGLLARSILNLMQGQKRRRRPKPPRSALGSRLLSTHPKRVARLSLSAGRATSSYRRRPTKVMVSAGPPSLRATARLTM